MPPGSPRQAPRRRFASLLAAMKGAYKHDAAVMAELAKFKRVQVRRAKAAKPAG